MGKKRDHSCFSFHKTFLDTFAMRFLIRGPSSRLVSREFLVGEKSADAFWGGRGWGGKKSVRIILGESILAYYLSEILVAVTNQNRIPFRWRGISSRLHVCVTGDI